MRALTWKHWVAIIVGGIAAGLLISYVLPHDTHPYFHSARRGPGAPAPATPSLASYLPWVLVFAGVILGAFNRNNTAFLTFAGGIVTAGVTVLTKAA